MRKVHILLFSMLILFGCAEENEVNTADSDFSGTWNWISTEGGIAAHIHESPETTGNSVQLVLTENLDYKVSVSGIEVSSGKYELTKEESFYSTEKENYITLENNFHLQNLVLNGIIRIGDDNILSISDNAYDGIGSRFEREN